ncbi:MAG TPA: ABC transporter permease [Gemmatimonadaceae bacterium]
MTPLLNDLRYRLRALFRRDTMDREMDAEFRFHLDKEVEKHVRAGVPPDEARRLARASFGTFEGTRDETRDARGLMWLEQMVHDVRYSLRGLAARPMFTGGVVLTLALGIGANATMFGIMDRMLFRAPPFLRDHGTVHRLYNHYMLNGESRIERNLAFPVYLDFLRTSEATEAVAAFQTRELPVGEGEDTREMSVTVASASYFSLFDARPALGRFFDASDDSVPAGQDVVVLGHGYWQSRFGGRTDVIGQRLRVGRTPATIIGVAPEGFVGLSDQGVPAVYLPITAFAFSMRGPAYPRGYGWSWLELAVRRKPDVSIAALEADLTASYIASFRRAAAIAPNVGTLETVRPRVTVGPVQLARGPQAGRDSRVVTWIAGVAFIVLLIACANVANLQLSRAISRQREVAVRLALGVSRGRLVRQLLTESLCLAILGGTTGLLVARWGSVGLRSFFFNAEESLSVVTDVRTLVFAGVATTLVALLTGLVPALQAGSGDLAAALKSGAREGNYRRSRTRTALLVLQATLSVALLVGAGLFVRSLRNVRDFRMGYDTERLLFATVNFRGVRLSDEEQSGLASRLLSAAREVPGVEKLTLAASVPFWSNEGRGLWVPGVDSVQTRGRFILQAGSTDYFATTGTRILRGRAFGESDPEGGAHVIVVSEGMAQAIWPGEDALGKCVRISEPTAPCATVIGVAEEVRIRLLVDDREHAYYVPAWQLGEPIYPQVLVRISGDRAAVAEALRRRLQRELPGASYATVVPMNSLTDPQQRSWRFGATMFVAFGALALVLAAIGLYSLIAYDVAQRTRELGVRMALGASVPDVMGLVVRGGLRLVTVGLVLGAGLALWGSKWMEDLMFRQSPRDPMVFGMVTILLFAVALIATAGPAYRAARVDPNVALRSD